jgi:SAM-dependent methyltransferase
VSRGNLFFKKLLWPGFNWVSRDKSIMHNLFLDSEEVGLDFKTLDVGCGNGFFSTKAALKGSSTLGITIQEWERENCEEMRDYLGISDRDLSFKASTLESLYAGRVNAEKYDQILMIDVLEHILDDRNALEQVRELLKDNGLFFVSVPSRDFEFDSKSKHVTRIENGWHVRHGYTFEQLEALLVLAGFEPIDRRSYGSLGTSIVGWLQTHVFRFNEPLMFAFFPILLLLSWVFHPWKRVHTLLVIARKATG